MKTVKNSLAKDNLLDLIDHIDELIFQMAYDISTEKFSFPFASAAMIKLFELDPKEIKKDASIAVERVYRSDLRELREEMLVSITDLTPWKSDFRVKLPNKGLRWLRGYGYPEKMDDHTIIWSGSVRDITEEKNLEKKLFENQERLRLAIEGSQDGIWDWHVPSNTSYYSEISQKMLGVDKNGLSNSAEAWNDRVHPDDRENYFKNIEDHFAGKTDYYVNEHRVKRNDGKYIWILDRGKVIERSKSGDPVRVIGTHSNITDIKEKEAEIVKTSVIVAEQNNRLLNFAHIVSHNLRSHSSNFESLISLIDATDEVTEKLDLIEYVKLVSDGLSETITHLNEVISVQNNLVEQTQLINLYDAIERIKNVLKLDIDKKQASVDNGVNPEIQIEYNPAYLESILLNLISNGIKYSQPGRKPRIKLQSIIKNNHLVLRVTDNGLGIDLDAVGSNLFGMYKTFHGNKDAKGIGLFITKNQIESMGGHIDVESVVGEGSVFEVVFK